MELQNGIGVGVPPVIVKQSSYFLVSLFFLFLILKTALLIPLRSREREIMQGYSVFSPKVSPFSLSSSLSSNPTYSSSPFPFKAAKLNEWEKRALHSPVVNPFHYAPNKPLLYFKVIFLGVLCMYLWVTPTAFSMWGYW